MLYLKLFILYSILGFFWESLVFKISNTLKHSGVLIGPYTLVYGFGGIVCFCLNNYINDVFLKYFIFTLACTLIELISGYLIKLIFHFDSWNYSYKKLHIGKYIAIDYALIWGIMSLVFVKYLNNFLTKTLSLIPDSFFIIILSVIIIDLIITFILYQRKK